MTDKQFYHAFALRSNTAIRMLLRPTLRCPTSFRPSRAMISRRWRTIYAMSGAMRTSPCVRLCSTLA